MRFRFWRAVDAVAHFLYCPAMLGRRSARYNRTHDVHLIPGAWLERVCDRFDLACEVTPQEMRREA